MHSVPVILFDLGLPSFDTIMHNCRAVYNSQVDKCWNIIIRHLNYVGLSNGHLIVIIFHSSLVFLLLLFRLRRFLKIFL